VENGTWEGKEVEEVLEGPIQKLGKVDTVVLGCTHYPLVRQTIEKMMPGVRVIDPGEEVVKNMTFNEGKSRFYLTKLMPEYPELAEMILGKRVKFELAKL
jgi:glutamate racemase